MAKSPLWSLLPKGLKISVLIFILVLIAGTIGFHLIQGRTLFTSLYWTVETVTTVGYGDILPTGIAGRGFAIGIMLMGVSLGLYALSSMVGFMVSGEFSRVRKVVNLNIQLENIKDHVIICGYGRVGRKAAEKMDRLGLKYVIVDKNRDVYNTPENGHRLFVSGDATIGSVLSRAGIARASFIISCIPDDSVNLYIIMEAVEMNPKIKTIVRASREESIKRYRKVGVTEVILPEEVAADQMVNFIVDDLSS
ncbi:potassium channel family protein [Oxyplasma meridianum]|uniref:Potassium channel family protein n=1 Tax=Oxyplasma meridianum TaxID=3073602 RepID=A0AAX4NEF3_9ARCH